MALQASTRLTRLVLDACLAVPHERDQWQQAPEGHAISERGKMQASVCCVEGSTIRAQLLA